MLAVCITVFGASFIVSLLASLGVRRLALKKGFVDRPTGRKAHDSPTPLGGGVGIWLATVFTVALGCLVAWLLEGRLVPDWAPAFVHHNVPGVMRRLPDLVCILAGGTILMILGLVDDIRGLSALLRFVIQIAVALAIFGFVREVRITAFVGSQTFSCVVTVLWIVGITNAFNLLDNMDGLSGGVAAIVSIIFLIMAVVTGQNFVAVLLLSLLGGTLGFLVLNFPPARIFMGDAGSLFLGYMLAVLTTVFTFYDTHCQTYRYVALLMPIIILAVPLFDTGTVLFIRWKRGRPLSQGDSNHFSHRLVALGMTRLEAVLTIYLVTFCTGLLAPVLLLCRLNALGAALIFVELLAILAVIAILERAGRRTK